MSLKAVDKISFFLSVIGLFMIFFTQITLLLKIEIYGYTTIVWYGYIFLVDGVIFRLRKDSLIINHFKKFLLLVGLSVIFWLLFELYNIFLHGWYYYIVGNLLWLRYILAFSSILPAVFETTDLIKTLNLFHKVRFHKIRISKKLIHLSIILGIIFLILPIFFSSEYMWALVWIGFVLLLDPINYLYHERSLISDLKRGNLKNLISLFIAGYICGFLWEFWNYWNIHKWIYTVPILDSIKIFEIPFLGFFAYGFFAWELYVMYYFMKLLIPKKIETELGLT